MRMDELKIGFWYSIPCNVIDPYILRKSRGLCIHSLACCQYINSKELPYCYYYASFRFFEGFDWDLSKNQIECWMKSCNKELSEYLELFTLK